MPLDNTIYKIKLAIINENVSEETSDLISSFGFHGNFSTSYDRNFSNVESSSKTQFEDWTDQYQEYFENRSIVLKIVIITLYSLIVLLSFFGNSIVCKIVFWNSKMRTTTNIYIGNLSISDILMTVLNVPLQLIRILSRNWPLGQFLCRYSSFFQCLSVNVSSFTMACIALDRYHVIVYPLRPRASMRSVIFKIIVIWGMAIIVSSPYPALAHVQEDITYNKMIRCRLIYPKSQYQFRQYLNLITLFIQYLIPLSITGITYFKICYLLWHKRNIEILSEEQRIQRSLSKWKTIKMLIVIFLVFAICWCPLNVYTTYQDFRGIVGNNKHSSVTFLICHWFAMSSVCYNPFLYYYLNDKFRNTVKSYVRWFLKLIPIHFNISSNFNVANKILKREVIKQTSKTSTLSSSLNSQNTNKSSLVHQNFEDKDPCNEKNNVPNSKKVNEEFVLKDFEIKSMVPT